MVTNNIAVIKYIVGKHRNKPQLLKESLSDFINTIKNNPEPNPISNAQKIISESSELGIEVSAEKQKLENLLK